jgi:hypothetical protein
VNDDLSNWYVRTQPQAFLGQGMSNDKLAAYKHALYLSDDQLPNW